MAKSFLNETSLSRGLRNNNPGNLIITGIDWSGKIPPAQNTDHTFEQFYDVNHGIRAMAYDIFGDVKQNNYSLSQLIHEYAPPSENDTAAYINRIAQATGINPDAPLVFDHFVLAEVLRSMIQMENGFTNAALITDEDIVDSIYLLPPLILSELGEFIRENKKSIIGVVFITTTLAIAAWWGYKYAA